jgi:demethylmenaquinone methyltransferase/2-methoxy-6-polyprenyl-1,4-benzoquinol methylase
MREIVDPARAAAIPFDTMVQDEPRTETPVVPHPPLPRYYAGVSERREFVSHLFDDGAAEYEWVNRVMSLGSGQKYRRDALARAGVGRGMTVLDVCMGSGQISRAAVALVGPEGRVYGLDASIRMLQEARRYVDVPMAQGRVEALPFPDGFADFVTMGYALRHVTDLRLVFREYRRVLKPGGRILLIEFARPRSRVAYLFAWVYLGTVVPALARLRGRRAAEMMRYFWDTIDRCVPRETILEALTAEGFVGAAKGGQLDLFAEYTARKPS